jgi:hypothetical protein
MASCDSTSSASSCKLQPSAYVPSSYFFLVTFVLPFVHFVFNSALLTDRTQSQFEASRLVMIQILLHGLKMDPLVSLHYYAPVCALINLAILPFTEGFAPFFALARVGPFILLSNAALAFGLNIAAVFLVGAGSGLVLTLAGVFKVQIHRVSVAIGVHPFTFFPRTFFLSRALS